jgi:hypothetical protein
MYNRQTNYIYYVSQFMFAVHVPLTPSQCSFKSSHMWTGRSGLRMHHRTLPRTKHLSNIVPPLSISPYTHSLLDSGRPKLHQSPRVLGTQGEI